MKNLILIVFLVTSISYAQIAKRGTVKIRKLTFSEVGVFSNKKRANRKGQIGRNVVSGRRKRPTVSYNPFKYLKDKYDLLSFGFTYNGDTISKINFNIDSTITFYLTNGKSYKSKRSRLGNRLSHTRYDYVENGYSGSRHGGNILMSNDSINISNLRYDLVMKKNEDTAYKQLVLVDVYSGKKGVYWTKW